MQDLNIYLVASYVGRPRDPKRTFEKGYVNDPDNMIYDEHIYLCRGLRDRDRKNSVVLNLTEQKIIKNTFKTGATFEEAFTHYYEGYGDYIDDCVNKLNEAFETK